MGLDIDGLRKKADFIRKEIVEVGMRNEAGHIASSLSCVDILVALYYSQINLSNDPQWEGRDRLVFSKAHGCYGLYAILSDMGYIDRAIWVDFNKHLKGCVERNTKLGLEVGGCGSLGHGLPIAVGIAFGARLQNKEYRVYCVVGDGEMQEGSNWEAIQFAVKHRLSNLTVIVDNNGLQAMDFVDNILAAPGKKDELMHKLASFGFVAQTSDGHDVGEIIRVISQWTTGHALASPQVLVANTVKGYGLLCMENVPKFHYRLPSDEELAMGNRYE